MSRLHHRVLLSFYNGGMVEHTSVSGGSNHTSSRLPLAFAGSEGASRPGLSFPLGTGLVVLIILFVSALFSFCYHWLTLKKTRRAASATINPSPSTEAAGSDAALQLQSVLSLEAGKPLPTVSKLDMVQCPSIVYMAGEYIPRFIAVPCPFQHPSRLTAQPAEEDIAAARQKALNSLEAIKLDIRH